MFTGLIQGVGKVYRKPNGVLVEGCERVSSFSVGESIAVDGVCLTVAKKVSNGFFADVSEETLRRTTLGYKAQLGDFVNLEPALCLSDRLGGHLVSGHVDGIGEVLSICPLERSWQLNLRWKEEEFSKYICNKGSIALNGISLTVAGFEETGSHFWIAVIPHTWESTSLRYLSLGSLVNLEADLMAKYAERLLEGLEPSRILEKNPLRAKISKDWLASQGWS